MERFRQHFNTSDPHLDPTCVAKSMYMTNVRVLHCKLLLSFRRIYEKNERTTTITFNTNYSIKTNGYNKVVKVSDKFNTAMQYGSKTPIVKHTTSEN